MENIDSKTGLQNLRNKIMMQANQIEDENVLKVALAFISRVREFNAAERTGNGNRTS